MRKFKVEHNDWEKKPLTITLFQPPYENVNVLNKTGWKESDCEIEELPAPTYDEE